MVRYISGRVDEGSEKKQYDISEGAVSSRRHILQVVELSQRFGKLLCKLC